MAREKEMAGAGATRETPAGGLSSRAPPTVAEEEQEVALVLVELRGSSRACART